MKTKARLIFSVAHFALVVLGLMVLGALVVVVPASASSLSARFNEFAGESVTIAILLSTPLAVFLVVLGTTALLLRLVQTDRMFSERVFKWVNVLSLASFVQGITFIVVGTWFSNQGGLPPFYLFGLLFLSLLSVAVGLVTAALLQLLKKATAVSQDLEGVI